MTSDARQTGGFSLIEVTLAVGLVAVGIVTLLPLLAMSSVTLRENRAKIEAIRLSSAVREELKAIGFENLYRHFQQDGEPYFAYTYYGDVRKLRDDGSPVPAAAKPWRPVHVLRQKNDPWLAEDLERATGHLFRLRLALMPPEPLEEKYELPEDARDYKKVSLKFFVDFYLEPSVEIAGERDVSHLSKVLSFPVSVER